MTSWPKELWALRQVEMANGCSQEADPAEPEMAGPTPRPPETLTGKG